MIADSIFMTALTTPTLSALLLGAISTALTGCGGTANSDDTPFNEALNGPKTPNVDPNNEDRVDPPETTGGENSNGACLLSPANLPGGAVPSVTANLDPVDETDFVGSYGAVRNAQTQDYEFGALESAGSQCTIATDAAECLRQFDELTSLDRQKAPGLHLIVSDVNGARELTTESEIRGFLGTIDTVNEAYILLRITGNTDGPDCDAITRNGANFETEVLRTNGCGEDSERLAITVKPDGSLSESLIELVPSNCAIGRLTEGVCFEPVDPHEAKDLGEYLSSVCHLETAAVAAFMQLALELSQHGAPERLIHGAHEAAAEEIEHAKETHRLAVLHGAKPKPIAYRPQPNRTLLELAIENAEEGCVRELYGAACAGFQARNAADRELRRTWAKIAREETSHAEWSLELNAWFHSQLSESNWRIVEEARAKAVQKLRATLSREPDPALAHRAGIPTAKQAELLFEALAPAFAA